MSNRPNIVVIQANGFRHDALAHAPNVARVGTEGTTFAHAYAAGVGCGPGQASLHTGREPLGHGVTASGFPLALKVPTLFGVLRDNGYDTAQIGRWRLGPVARKHGFGTWIDGDVDYLRYWAVRGFDVGEDEPEDPQHRSVVVREDQHHLDRFIIGRAVEWLDGQRPNPFALWVTLAGPEHGGTPQSAFERVKADDIKLPLAVRDTLTDKPASQSKWMTAHRWQARSAADWQTQIARYQGTVEWLDTEIGRLLDKLDEAGLTDNTITVFTSDHGTLIGEHRMHGVGPFLYEEVVRIPLLVRWPGYFAAGKTRQELVSQIDLMPSLTTACAIPMPSDIDGLSFVPLLRNESCTWRTAVTSLYHGAANVRMLRTTRHKYVWTAGDLHEVYLLTTDPLEMRNLIHVEEMREAVERLQERLIG